MPDEGVGAGCVGSKGAVKSSISHFASAADSSIHGDVVPSFGVAISNYLELAIDLLTDINESQLRR